MLVSLPVRLYTYLLDVVYWDRKLMWNGITAALSNLVSPDADLSNSIETLTFSTFDPRNQYSGVVRAVRAAVGDEEGAAVKVYRVEVARSRVEYFVLALDGTEGLVVGLRAKAIET